MEAGAQMNTEFGVTCVHGVKTKIAPPTNGMGAGGSRFAKNGLISKISLMTWVQDHQKNTP
jgi:hypothetical protein